MCGHVPLRLQSDVILVDTAGSRPSLAQDAQGT
jgi:hypothetical protein